MQAYTFLLSFPRAQPHLDLFASFFREFLSTTTRASFFEWRYHGDHGKSDTSFQFFESGTKYALTFLNLYICNLRFLVFRMLTTRWSLSAAGLGTGPSCQARLHTVTNEIDIRCRLLPSFITNRDRNMNTLNAYTDFSSLLE